MFKGKRVQAKYDSRINSELLQNNEISWSVHI